MKLKKIKKLSQILLSSMLLVCVVVVLTSCDKVFNQVATSVEELIKEETEASSSNETNDANVEIDEEENIIHEAREVLSAMEVLEIAGFRDTDKSTYIEITFSKELKDGFDGTSYIKVEPDVTYSVSKVEDKLMLRGEFDPKQKYKVSVLTGVVAVDGSKTTTEKSEDIVFDQKKPKIMFSNEGIILPSVNEKKIYIRSMNVKKINVVVKKVYANNLTQFLQHFNFAGNGYIYKTYDEYYDEEKDEYVSNDTFEYVGDELYNVDFDIENEIDTWVQTAIDLTDVIDGNGLYIFEAKFDKDGTSYKFETDPWWYLRNNAEISKTILLTDLGIIAKKTDDGLNVNVLNIVENKLLSGTKVYLMSKNNQILEEKTTDADGSVHFENHKNSFYILADNSKSKSILLLKNALSLNGFAADGAYVSDGINAYVYTERGVYRPGDNVYVSVIAHSSGKPLEKNQPITLTVYDPTGVKMIENDVIKNGKDGFYTYTFKTDLSARTGIWKLEAKIGDEVFNKDISIETVVPNRLKVNVNIPDVVEDFENPTDWSISSNYLFGEPAGDLNYDVSLDIREEPIDFEKYKDYTFNAPTLLIPYAARYVDGKLDKDGIGKIEPDLSNLQFRSINMLADVSGRVYDDGGRPVTTSKYVKLKKYDTYIGIENTNTYKKPGSKLNLKVICVTSDGENLIPNKELKYRIYGNNHYWWWDYSSYDHYIRTFKSDKNTTLLKEGTIRTLDVPALLDDVVPESEHLYVEIEDESTGQLAGVNIQSSEWVDSSITKKIETLNLSADKKKYSVGDVAEIKYKGANLSKAIITIEKAGKIINEYYRDVDSVDMTEEITITKDMAPNVYVYVTLLQDYNTKENDRPLRLYGVIPLNVEDEDSIIDLEISAPDEIKPNEKFTVNIHNKKEKQFDFTIAVVDEGLLDITAFKTPNPFEHFFKKLAAKLSLYDNYSEIIDRPYGAINQILKVGGDEGLIDEMARRRRLKELGLEEADRFTPVSMYKGVLTTDSSGNASVDFDMPNYMGSVRIMVVAAEGESFGSAEKNMIVKAPIIVEPTLPRTMKIGDKMNIPVSVFALEENIGDIEVYYTFKDKTETKKLNLAKGEKEVIYFEEEIGDEVGSATLTIGARSNVYNYEETVGMAINSNNAPISLSETKELKGRQEAIFENKDKYVKGTVNSVLTISSTMMLGLDQRLKFLIKYPYGCAEQTTSSVFPQLFIDDLSTIKDYNKKEVVENINAGISRLRLFNLPDGSFSYWPGDNYTSEYATNYIGHFLIYAKKNGYYIPDSMYDKWIDYTSKKVRGTNVSTEYDIDSKCYSLYLLALAGKQNVSEMNYMYENHMKTMTETAKMYLAAAYKLAGEGATAINISSNINAQSIKKKYDEMEAKDRYYYSYSFGSRLRELAVYLDCYHTIYEKRDDNAFKEILTAMRTKDFYSTQTTSYSLLALANVTSNNAGEEIKGKVDVDGVITEWSTKDQYRITLYEDTKKVRVIPEVDIMVYVNYFLEGVPVNTEQKNYSEGFNLVRTYYDDEGNKIDAKKLKSGDMFWLEVVAKPTNKEMGKLENIAITQVLPTGWEIENLRLTNKNVPKWVEDKTKDTLVSYTDIRDDRVMWFFNCDGDKSYTFFVKLTAVTKGEFDFPGTTLEAMYDYNYRAFRKGEKVKVE